MQNDLGAGRLGAIAKITVGTPNIETGYLLYRLSDQLPIERFIVFIWIPLPGTRLCNSKRFYLSEATAILSIFQIRIQLEVEMLKTSSSYKRNRLGRFHFNPRFG